MLKSQTSNKKANKTIGSSILLGDWDTIHQMTEQTLRQDNQLSGIAPTERNATQGPVQAEMPFAIVLGEQVTEIPRDLYIPPDALEVFLETFEGPLDLLLYLIRRQNLDILNVNVARITEQYMEYVEAMKAARFELAAEYLLMAALLAEIKSRTLLPRQEDLEDEEDDPRAQLLLKLQEYERYKEAAESIDELPRVRRDIYPASADLLDLETETAKPDVDLQELLTVFAEVMHRADMFKTHQIMRERLSTRERMAQVLDQLQPERFVSFMQLFAVEEGRLGVAVTFLALMELIKESLVETVQNEAYGAIYVKARQVGAPEPQGGSAGRVRD